MRLEELRLSIATGLRSFIMHLLPPPHPAFKLRGRLEPEILPLLGELNPAKRASQREHQFSIISPSWWPPPSLFSSSGRSCFLLPLSFSLRTHLLDALKAPLEKNQIC